MKRSVAGRSRLPESGVAPLASARKVEGTIQSLSTVQGVEPGKLVKLPRPAGVPLKGRVGPVVIQLLPE